MVWNFRATWREFVERKPNTCKTNQTSGWSGADDKGKGKIGTGKGKGEPGKGKGKGNLGKGKGKGEQQGQKWKKRISRNEGGTKTSKKHKPVKNTQSGRTRVGITLTTGLMQTGGRATAAQICGMILHGNKRLPVSIDAAGSRRTVQSNAWWKHFNVRWFDDVRIVSQCLRTVN